MKINSFIKQLQEGVMKRNSVRISRVLLSSTIIIIVSFSLINCSGDENNPTTSTINYGTIDDIDGNSYKTVQIGTQWWMAENLKVTHYRDGQPIPNVTDSTDWSTIIPTACLLFL